MGYKKVIIIFLSILLLLFSGVIGYSVYVNEMLKTVMMKPIRKGSMTIYPGIMKGGSINLFGTTLELRSSRIDMGNNKIEVPSATIKVKFNKLIILINRMEVQLVSMKNYNLIIDDLIIEASLLNLKGDHYHIEATAKMVDIHKADMGLLFYNSKLIFLNESSFQWDKLDLTIPTATLTQSGISDTQFRNIKYFQTYQKDIQNSVRAKNEFDIEQIRYRSASGLFSMNQQRVSIDWEQLIENSEDLLFKNPRVLFYQGIKQLQSLKATLNLFELQIPRGSMSINRSTFGFKNEKGEEHYTLAVTTNFDYLQWKSERSTIKAEKIALNASSRNPNKKIDQLIESLHRMYRDKGNFIVVENNPGDLLDALQDTSEESNFTITKLSLKENKTGRSLLIPESSIDFSLRSENGILEGGAGASFTLERKRTKNKTNKKGPIHSITFDLGVKLQQFDIQGFQYLKANTPIEKRQLLKSTLDRGIKKFVLAKPAVQINMDATINRRSNVEFHGEYGLVAPVQFDASISEMLQSQEGAVDLGKQLLRSAQFNMKLKIDRYNEILNIPDRNWLNKIGKMIPIGQTALFKIDDQTALFDLKLKKNRITHNGVPNGSLQRFWNQNTGK